MGALRKREHKLSSFAGVKKALSMSFRMVLNHPRLEHTLNRTKQTAVGEGRFTYPTDHFPVSEH